MLICANKTPECSQKDSRKPVSVAGWPLEQNTGQAESPSGQVQGKNLSRTLPEAVIHDAAPVTNRGCFIMLSILTRKERRLLTELYIRENH